MSSPSLTHTRQAKFVYLRLLWGDLCVHPMRSAVSAVAIALQVFLILLIVGLTTGMLSDYRSRTEGIGADMIVQPPNASMFVAFSNAVMPQSVAPQIAKLPGVDEAAGVLIVVDTHSLGVTYGIDYDRFNGLSKGFTFLSGGPFTQPDDAIADDLAASAKHLKVGSTTTLINHQFRICGIVLHGKGARYFVPLRTAQDVAGADGRISMVYVRSAGDIETVRAELVKAFPSYRVRSMAEYLSLMTSSNLPELRPFLNSFVGLGIVISFLVVLLTMYTMVLERRRQIGVLKALGCTRFEICRLIIAEALFLVVLGAALGVVVTYSITTLLHHTSPTLQIQIPVNWIGGSILVAVVGALVGSAYPAFRAAQSDPVDALATE
jgi:putative ABC transport system permease protein